MATLCTHCGTTLKDGARYCNNCGTLVPSHPLSAQSVSSSHAADSSRPGKPEQIAQHSPPRPVRYSVPGDPPSWMSQLDNQLHNQGKAPSDSLKAGQPQPSPSKTPTAPFHEVEHLKTVPLSTAPSVQPVSQSVHEVEHLKTVPLSTEPSVQPVSQPVKPPGQHQQWEQPSNPETSSIEHPTRDRPTHQNAPAYIPSYSRPPGQNVQERSSIPSAFTPLPDTVSTQEVRQAPLQEPFLGNRYSVSPTPRRKNRKLLAIVLVFLVLLIVVGGVGAWVVVSQPFSVPGITQPQQSFKDARLGFSLLYPNGWRFQEDQRKATAHFYDSSSTAQVNIVVRPSNGEDLGQYLQREAIQLGMTGPKKGPALSFAGASWQQMQGSVLERGASYTGTVVVTVHNQHLFTMLLLAPQITYAQEDQLVFSGIRSSFQFGA